jgi:hypothetical protein
MREFLRRDGRWLAALAAAFGASRLAAWAIGVRFDPTNLDRFWQFLDPALLRDDLGRSLFYQHSQPPLFNLFAGIALKLAPGDPSPLFAAVYMALGLATCLGCYALMRSFDVARPLAWAVPFVLVIRPSFLFLENKLIYDLPSTALLVLSACALAAALAGRLWGIWAFFGLLGVLCGLRALFHPLFFVLAILLWAHASGARRARDFAPALLPLALLLGIQAKNWLLFDQFGMSSWLGMNLARVVTQGVPPEERAELARIGAIDPILQIRPMVPLKSYPPQIFPPLRWPEVPVLAAAVKSNGEPNFNHEHYLILGQLYRDAALREIAREPGRYARTVARNVLYMLQPVLVLPGRAPNGSFERYVDVWERFVGLRVVVQVGEAAGKPLYTFYYLAYSVWPLALLFGLWAWWRSRGPAEALALGGDRRPLLAFLLLSIVWVLAIGSTLEVGENQRFRFYTDPFTGVLIAIALDRAWRRWRSPSAAP